MTDQPSLTLELPALTDADLGAIRAFVARGLESVDCGSATDAFVLAVDEVCANLAEHTSADGQTGPVCIRVRRTGLDAIIVVEDSGRPFHPASAPAPDLDTDWPDRRVGGLGWFFVRQMVDDINYETVTTPRGPINRLTLTKRGARRAPHIASD